MSMEFDHKRFINSLLIKVGLCVWMGIVIFVFLIVFWPSAFQPLVWSLGLLHYLQLLQSIITPLLTANYLS